MYEAKKWAIKVDNTFPKTYKDFHIKKRTAYQEPKYISILKYQVASAKNIRDSAKQNIIYINKLIDAIKEYIKITETNNFQLQSFVILF